MAQGLYFIFLVPRGRWNVWRAVRECVRARAGGRVSKTPPEETPVNGAHEVKQ